VLEVRLLDVLLESPLGARAVAEVALDQSLQLDVCLADRIGLEGLWAGGGAGEPLEDQADAIASP